MLNILYAEFQKLKATKLIWLILIGAAMPVLLNSLVEFETFNWPEFFNNNLIFLNVLLGAPLLSIVAGYVTAREYTDHTINQLFTYPYHRVYFLIGKMKVTLFILLFVHVLNFGLIVLSGHLISAEVITSELFLYYLVIYGWMFVLQSMLIPITMTAGILGKSYIPPIVLGIIAVLINALALSGFEDENSGRIVYSSYFPFSSMIVHLMRSIENHNVDGIIHALYPHSLTFILFFVLNMIYYIRSDVYK
jgi:hypothetical protein